MNSVADNMAQREARKVMNQTHTGRHINNVAEAAQVSAGHGGDTFKAQTMAYHSPAIVKPLNPGYSHTQDAYAYQQTYSSQFNARQVAESTLISNPFAAEDDFYDYIRNDHYYEVARQDTIYNLIASNKSKLTIYGIENETLQNQVRDYEALYYEMQGFYAKQQRLYSSVSQSVVGIGQSIKDTGNALGDIWYADFSSGKATLDWVSGKISTSEYSNILEANAATRRSTAIGFVSGAVENALNINSPAGGLGIIGQLWYIETGDTSISDVTSNLFQRKDDYLVDTFNLNEEQFNNGKAGANTYVMVSGLAVSLGSSINARSSGYVSVADTPIADPYRMSYSGNAQVKMPGFTSTAQREAFYQLRAARAQASATIEGGSLADDLHRPYIRKNVRQQVEANAPKTVDGKFIDPNTGMVIEGKYDLGHKPGNEFWREKAKAQSEGLTQKQFNDRMNNSDYYQIESPSSNRSHKYEKK